MSDATLRIPAQSASQLSENIGDVLASIRRLIAQDEAAEAAAAAAARPAPSAPAPEAAEGSRRVPFAESASRRRDILAEAQALTRRSEAAFGQAAQAIAPLTLGAAERVAPGVAALPGRAAAMTDQIAENAAKPLVLTGSVAAPAGSPAAPVAQAVQAIATAAPQAATEDADIPAPHPACAEGTTNEDKAENMNASEILAPALGSRPAGQTGMEGAPALAVGGPQEAAVVTTLQPALPASPSAQPALGAPSAAPLAPAPAMAAAAPASPAPARAEATEPGGQRAAPPLAPTPAPVIEDAATAGEEDCAATILRDMIREVVRQELTGDPAGRMAGDLRSMIMREVAQVLTKGVRGTR